MPRLLYIVAGHVCVALGVIGIFLPLLPTTPFLLLAAGCYSRGSERFHTWLLNHPTLGPPVTDWNAHGVIRPRAKAISVTLICATLSVPIFVIETIPLYGKLGAAAVGICVITFLLSRPSAPTEGAERQAAGPAARSSSE